ncbi:MAG: SPFH/Band 7/PHB domain protein [Verrucomicrobiales bacterium]|nr:SPFH/Band 7/PHB domain protein [Verrucomicrobiales bacterium]
MNALLAAAVTFAVCFVGVPLVLWIGRMFGLYVVVQERRCLVYVLFGKVVAILEEPGLHFLLAEVGVKAFIVNWLGRCHVIDMRLDQQYLRSQAVNSEEGAPMGIGIWHEMYISDPVSYLFKNTDPRGSLGANVSNSTVRCLSNMPLAVMLVDRHAMSNTVRQEVSPKSHEWGYRLGSVYIRKVHFRDLGMIRQIESKVVNRLRQVTSAIKQDGANQVSIITSTAERQAAVEFAKAAAIRPQIVGAALQKISADPAVSSALFEVLETQKLLAGPARITLVPDGGSLIGQIAAADSAIGEAPPAAASSAAAHLHPPPPPPATTWPQVNCPSCNKPFRIDPGSSRVACPHCAQYLSVS